MTDTRMRKVCGALGLVSGVLGVLTFAATSAVPLLAPFGGVLLGLGWAMLALLTIRSASDIGYRRLGGEIQQLRAELSAHDERGLSRTRRVEDAIEAERAKESRHEYHMEQSLNRLENRLGELSARTSADARPAQASALDILFVTSNGAGLGHVTRLLAMAQHLGEDARVELLTLSRAYRTLGDAGFVLHYFPSADAADVPPRRWNEKFTHYFSALVKERRPSVVVFDGTWVYYGLTYVCRGLGIPLVWVQRGNWKPEVDQASVQRHNAAAIADEVILPGDYAIDEHIDVGSGIEPVRVGPVTLLRRSQLLDREEALAELGLDPAGKYVLVSLGGGTLGEAGDARRIACETITALGSSWRAVIVRSPLSHSQGDPAGDAQEISAYPVMLYSRAFEFVVSAAGYNSVQEAVSLGVPSILVPNDRSVTDDQVARAQGAADKDLALMARSSQELESRITELAESLRRRRLQENLATVEEASGGLRAAEALETIVERSRWEEAADRLGIADDREQ